MLEAPNLAIAPGDRGISYQSGLRIDTRMFVNRQKYGEIPASMRRAARKAALKALLIPRENLYKKIIDLDKKASMTDPVGSDVSNPIESLQEHRMKMLMEVKKRFSLSEIQRSTYLTTLDRILIAQRETSSIISRRRGKRRDGNSQDNDLMAAQKLCADIIRDQFANLPPHERRDPEIMDSDPEVEFGHFKKWMHQAAAYDSMFEI
ncbi:MAG TPA: hypothetical protein VLG67_02760 [Candidatus Saccharimonadales bacterium]|nr:hypothetical protein [Candidatus Saccharimonadales bacterium]